MSRYIRFAAMSIWSEHLTDAQLRMVMESGHDAKDGAGFGIELRGGQWATALSLERMGLGQVDGAPGLSYPGMYWNNAEGVRITHEFDEDEE